MTQRELTDENATLIVDRNVDIRRFSQLIRDPRLGVEGVRIVRMQGGRIRCHRRR